MLCKLFRQVPFARCGDQEYRLHEIGRTGNDIVTVNRPVDEVRKSAPTFENVPVTVTHPGQLVNSSSVDRVIVGMASDVRFDEATQQLRADLMIWEPNAIQEIASGLRELSGGYKSEYDEIPGGFQQKNIRGNHIALVMAARAGSEARIGA